jgi:regulator of replication initiation timing
VSPLLDGVRIGPLDPDRGETFGQVGGQSAARRLVRHHAAMHPPALLRALRKIRQDARSEVVDRDEAEGFIRAVYAEAGEELPDDSTITGYAVRGDDDSPGEQVLTFTWTTKGGRTGKGFVPYGHDRLSSTRERGDAAVELNRLKTAGLPVPEQLAAVAALKSGSSVPETDDELVEENDRLDEENAELRARIAELEEQVASGEAPVEETPGPQTVEGGRDEVPEDSDGDGEEQTDEQAQAAALSAAFPDGYDGVNAQDAKRKVRDANDPVLARAVLAEETAGGSAGRGTVVAAANEVLDRSSS